MTELYEDDSEYGAGLSILAILNEKYISNQSICVSSWYGGKHLGPARSNHIEEAAYVIINAMTNV
jgi:putative IMPACT (imprinted ancient) family translation regulator